ncbi:hypothetical protein AOQ84DRAFT_276479, partial [Glonium stellatum]
CKIKFRGDQRCRKGNLNRHLRSYHEKLQLFPCPEPGCDKRYKRMDTLQQHERTH